MWYHTGLPAVPIRWVLVKDPKGKFQPQALLCTDTSAQPIQILHWFRQRWQLEVTFEEVRAHLGVESQRQWSSQAIARTTPALLALFSIWYRKTLPTFANALALVRQQLWQMQTFQLSSANAETVKVPRALFKTWSGLLCYAA